MGYLAITQFFLELPGITYQADILLPAAMCGETEAVSRFLLDHYVNNGSQILGQIIKPPVPITTQKGRMSADLAPSEYLGKRQIQTSGQNVCAPTNYYIEPRNFTLFALTVYAGKEAFARLLLVHDVNLNPRDVHGKTPLLLCLETGNLQIMHLLLSQQTSMRETTWRIQRYLSPSFMECRS